MTDRNPYPPASVSPEPDPPIEVVGQSAALPVDPHTTAVSAVGADMSTRLAALDKLYAEQKITASELGEARRRVLAEGVPGAAPTTPALPVAPPPAAVHAAPAASPAPPLAASAGGAGGAAPPAQVNQGHIGPPEPPPPKKMAGLPVWAAAGIAAAVVAGLIIAGILLFTGGGGNDGDSPQAQGAEYAAQVKVPLGQLTSSVVVVGKNLARADAPADLKSLNRLAERQIDVVEEARRRLSRTEVTPADAQAQKRLIAAAAAHRRWLVQLGRATAANPTEASLKQLNRSRSAAGETLAAYRSFFAIAKGAPDAITATDITDVTGVRTAINEAIEAQTQPPTTTGGATAKAPTGPYTGNSFQSPTGNLRCQVSGSLLFCSSSNDGFGVSLPDYGVPSTGSGVASGGQSVPYGDSWVSGPFRCDSAFDGITCYNRSGNGFFLNRDQYNPF